jgi:hypothetical protein
MAGRTRWQGAVVVLVAVAWAAVPLIVLGYHTLRQGGILSGTDGALAGADQQFYLDQLRQSAQHVLITDHFDLGIGRAVFANPLYLLAGLPWLAGLSIQASFWLLQLLAAPVLALGSMAFVRRYLVSGGQKLLAAGLGLFYFSPVVALLVWTGAVSPFQHFELNFPAGESMPAWQLWGYPHAAICTGLLAAALGGATSIASAVLDPARGAMRRAPLLGISAAGLIVGWLHPWQGATLIAVLVLLALYGRSGRLAGALLLPVVATAAPMVYEEVLVRTDSAWHLDALQNTAGHVPLWMLLAVLLPLILAALPGLLVIPAGPLRLVAGAWPIAALSVYFATSQFPYHALQGISIPLAVLAVAGSRRWRRPSLRWRAPFLGWAAAGAAVLCVGAGVAYEAVTLSDSLNSHVAPYWLTPSERDALAYLDHAPQRGGVFADYYLGMSVPAFTGRRTWLGEWTWTPHFARRQALADALQQGGMPASQARALVAGTGARFALIDCGASRRVGDLLRPLVASEHRFGCAYVYLLRSTHLGNDGHAVAKIRPPRTFGATEGRRGRDQRVRHRFGIAGDPL